MDKIELTSNLINAVLSYLGTRPYTEVVQLIDGIHREAQAAALAAKSKEQQTTTVE